MDPRLSLILALVTITENELLSFINADGDNLAHIAAEFNQLMVIQVRITITHCHSISPTDKILF